MLQFMAVIKKFANQGEKTGWTYIEISSEQAFQLNGGGRTSFRVTGKLDQISIEKVALMPMGNGHFIMALNADIRKSLKKGVGNELKVSLKLDKEAPAVNAEFVECLQDEPQALTYFNSLNQGHRLYFSRWIESAKTETTKAKRIATAVTALSRKMGFPEMLQSQKKEREQLGL